MMAYQCALCGAFLKRGPKVTCRKCGAEWQAGGESDETKKKT